MNGGAGYDEVPIGKVFFKFSDIQPLNYPSSI
jgi:hypothetical protein